MRRFAASCVAILLFIITANAQRVDSLSARDIIYRVTEVYASCTSYLDEGKEEVKDANYGGRVSHSSFTTAFVRPNRFRFEESLTQPRGEKRRFIAWQEGERGSVWPAAKRSTSGWTGAYSAFANTLTRRAQKLVLGLLFPDSVRRDTLLDLTDMKLVGEERLNGRLTFRIEGNLAQMRAFRDERGYRVSALVPLPTTVWIDQQEFLILKIRQKPVERLSITTTFKPVINVEVAPDKLAFNPPSAPTPDSGPSTVEIINFHFSELVRKVGNSASLTYVYELKVRNRSEKEIAAVAWEQTFTDPASKRVRRQTHFSDQNVGPNESSTLKDEIRRGPSKIVNVQDVNPEGDGNQVQVSCVIYTDGSWWKDPAAKMFECEYLRRVRLKGK